MIRTRDTLLRYAVFPGLWFKPTHPTLQCCYSSPSEIRTHTEQVLNLLPLPIGLPDRGGIISPNISSTTLTLTGQALPNFTWRDFGHCAPARTRTLDPLIKSQLLYQLSYKSVVIPINFHDFNAISRIRTYTPRLHAESSTSCRLMTAQSLQEEYQPQNTYSDIIVHERVSDSDGLFGV